MAALQAALAKFRSRAVEQSNVLEQGRKEREEKLAKKRDAEAKAAPSACLLLSLASCCPSLHCQLSGPQPVIQTPACRPQGTRQAQGQEQRVAGLGGRALRLGRRGAAALEGLAAAQPAGAAGLPPDGGWCGWEGCFVLGWS